MFGMIENVPNISKVLWNVGTWCFEQFASENFLSDL